jgi:hypothetical protein
MMRAVIHLGKKENDFVHRTHVNDLQATLTLQRYADNDECPLET